MNRFRKTITSSSLGFIGGLLLEHGIEAFTGVDFVNGVCEIAGAVLGAAYVNRDLAETIVTNCQRIFHKEPIELTRQEWDDYRKRFPASAEWLEKALQV